MHEKHQTLDATAIPEDSAEHGLVGSIVGGRYRLLRPLASGGLGRIYEATHVELGRPIAIKVLSDEVAHNADAIKRFQREAQTASQLGHPNIVDVHDFGRTSDGRPYLAMERLEGRDLDDELAAVGVLPIERVLAILGPVASALDAVHARGIVHRDIKPANIFLAHKGGSEQIKLLDFGLAAFHERGDRLTQLGTVVGTPHYMPPESAEGALCGPEGDVYSLAVVAYECIAGVLPFDAELASGVLVKKVARPAPTMSQRTNRQHDPAIEAVLSRALSRTPSRRPQSAGAFIEELRAAAAGAEPAAPPALEPDEEPPISIELSSSQAIVSKPSSTRTGKRRALLIAASAAILTLIGAAAFWLAGHDSPAIAEREPLSPPAEPPPPEPPPPPPELAERIAAEPAPPTPEPETLARSAATTARRVEQRTPSSAAPTVVEPALASAASSKAPVPRRNTPARADEAPDSTRAQALVRDAQRALIGGELGRARSLFRQATATDPSHAPAWRGLGVTEERMNHAPEAARAYRRYLRLMPQARDAASVRARLRSLGG